MTTLLLEHVSNKEYLNDCLGKLPGARRIEVDSVELRRHKAGRRSLFELQARFIDDAGRQEPVRLFGKVRNKGVDEKTFVLNEFLYHNGFNEHSEDWISIPQPVALVPEVHMSLYRKAEGQPVITKFKTDEWEFYARQIVRAAYKLNQSQCVLSKQHSIDDELTILDQRMSYLFHEFPSWVNRLLYLKFQYKTLAQRLPMVKPLPIHRDYYHDQVICDRKRIYLLDLDTCSMGDPALDIGNFLGHLVEHAVRHQEFSQLYPAIEQVVIDEFGALYPLQAPDRIKIYVCLTLIRHVYISSQMPERRAFTAQILHECERQILALSKGKSHENH